MSPGQTGDGSARGVLGALLFLRLPTVILNGAYWEQCDIIFTTFLLAFVWSLIRGRPLLAMLMFSMALSIKVQAIFAAPFVVYLVLGPVSFLRFNVVLLPLIIKCWICPPRWPGVASPA